MPTPDDPLAQIEELRSQIRRLETERSQLDGQLSATREALTNDYEAARTLIGLGPDFPVSADTLSDFIAHTETELAEVMAELKAEVDALLDEVRAHATPALEGSA